LILSKSFFGIGDAMASYVPANLEAVLAELETEADRAVAILGASLVEHFLENAIVPASTNR
jgi:hypothetical protein